MSRNWKVVVSGFAGRVEGLTQLEALLLANAITALTGRKAEAQPISSAIRRPSSKSRSA